MKNTFLSSLPPVGTRARSAVRVLSVFLVALFITAVYLTIQFFQNQLWQLWVEVASVWAVFIINIVSFNLARRGNPDRAIWLTFVPWLGAVLLTSATIAGVGVVLLIAVVSIVTMVAGQALQGRQATNLIILGAITGIAAIFIDGFITIERITLPGFQSVILILTFILLALYGYLIFSQFRTFSLGTKIVMWTGLTLVAATTILVTYATLTYRQAEITSRTENAVSIAQKEAELIREELNVPLITARTLAQSFGAIKNSENQISLSREQVNGILKDVLAQNPSFLGTYTLWEPNAFDGLDNTYAGSAAHDETGRFIPYWVRDADGNIHVEALIDYETPGIGDWYILPRQSKQEVTIAPLIYPIGGEDVTMASFVVPILYNNTFYGIVGVDAPIEFVQGIVNNLDLHGGTSQAVVLSDTGTLIAVQDRPDLVNKHASEVYPDFAELQPRLAAGEAFTALSSDDEHIHVFSPIYIGETGTRWYFSLVIPYSELTVAAATAATRQIAISSSLILLALIILWSAANRLVQPILSLTEVANEISQGNLNVTANVQSEDETGVLAKTFNQMISQLRDAFATLEERVAERTRGLELAAEVGHSVSQVRSLNVMLTDAVELIRKQFDLYYVQVYLINPSQTHLTLEAGTGDAGKTLLDRNHQLPLNGSSLNGRAAIEKKSIVIENTLKSVTFKPNPLLPDTRSEMAVPLVVGDKVVGVLDMQSSQEEALNQDLLPAFEALAGQLAIAIQNANLLAETEQARAEVEAQARWVVRSNWLEYLDAIHKPERTGFVFEKNQVLPLDETEPPHISEEKAVVAPISVTGETIGSLAVELDENSSPIARESGLVEEVARQVALHIESLRLLENAERFRAEAEEASRRLTREGWQDYLQTNTDQTLSFYYNLKEVQPFSGNGKNLPKESMFDLPLKVRNETIGKLAIQGLESADSETLELASAVAERLSAHVESLRQIEETRRNQIELDKRAQELAAVAEISTISSQELDIQKMLATVVHLTQRKFGYYHAHVFVFNENTQHLKIAACGWKEGDEHEGTHGAAEIPLMQEQSLVARAARTRQAVIVNDVKNEPGWLPNPLLPDTASELAVPLVVGDHLLGVLDVQSDRVNAFTEEDANIQTTLASQVATALQNAQSFAKAQMQAQRESTLNAISQKIQSATTVEAVLQIAARELGHALGAPMTIAQLSKKDSSS
ncbi:MAG: hypothetical protein OHK003_01870 [Anaerolineales bacterium]